MTAGPEPGGIDELPRVIPIFPLPGVLLLPRGRLPLNIFEPRYLQMTQDAMASHRMIGMIQPADPQAKLDAPEVYPVGCIGRITSFSETPDNRFLITLTGVLPFRNRGASWSWTACSIGESAPTTAASPATCRSRRRSPSTGAACCQRSGLTSSATGLTADWDAIDRASDEALVTCLAMACPFEAEREAGRC